jgi:hypothetical protein
MRLATTSFVFALLLAFLAPAPAPATILVYEQGSVGFEFDQYPSGPYGGAFLSNGNVTDPSAFAPGGSGASMAVSTITVAGAHHLAIFGAVRNSDTTGDLAFLYLRSSSELTPGTYPVDPVGFTAIFGFVDDATSLDFPDDPDVLDWQAWIAGLNAEHKLLSATGSIEITKLNDVLVEGKFSGITGEFGNGFMATIKDGTFSIDPPPLSVDKSSWGSIKNLYR